MNLLEHLGRATVDKVEKGRKHPAGAQLFPHQRRFCERKKKNMAGNNQKEPYQSMLLQIKSIIFCRNCK
jgi:hypothetical protein